MSEDSRAEYYQQNKERMCEKYQNLSNEEKKTK